MRTIHFRTKIEWSAHTKKTGLFFEDLQHSLKKQELTGIPALRAHTEDGLHC